MLGLRLSSKSGRRGGAFGAARRIASRSSRAGLECLSANCLQGSVNLSPTSYLIPISKARSLDRIRALE